MKKITRWTFVEIRCGKGMEDYISPGTYATKKECREFYKSLCSDTESFGNPGSKVEYVKLTGTRK